MRRPAIFLTLFFICLDVPAENLFEQGGLISPANFEAIEILAGSPEHAEKLLRNLQRYESYRPDSYSDATKNPFNKNNLDNHDDEDSLPALISDSDEELEDIL